MRFRELSQAGPPIIWQPWMALVVAALFVLGWSAGGYAVAVLVFIAMLIGWQLGMFMCLRGYQRDPDGWQRSLGHRNEAEK